MVNVLACDGQAAAAAMKARMTELGLTQFDLAARSGVSLATVREMLAGRERKRSPRTLAAVSEALGQSGEADAGAEIRAIRADLERLSRRLDALEAGRR